jgi:hypothetical protein
MRKFLVALILLVGAVPFCPAQEPLALAFRSEPTGSYPRNFEFHGTLITYDQYASDGSGREIVSLDMLEHTRTVIAKDVADFGRPLLSLDEHFAIVLGSQRFAPAIRVLDRKSGNVVAQKRLRDGAVNAIVDGKRLLVVQQSEVLEFELSTMKLLKSDPLAVARLVDLMNFDPAASTVLSSKELLLARAGRARIYDKTVTTFDELPLPEAKTVPPYGPWLWLACVSGTNLVMNASGDLLVFDIVARSLRYTIHAFAMRYSVAIAGGLMWVKPRDVPDQTARVFDVMTGREILRFEFTGTFVGGVDDLVVAIDPAPVYFEPQTLSVYKVSSFLSAGGGPEWQRGAIIQAHRDALQAVAATGDVFAGLDVLSRSGVESAAEEILESKKDEGPPLLAALEDYARWLTRTVSHADEGAILLERLSPLTRRTYEAELLEAGTKHLALQRVPLQLGSEKAFDQAALASLEMRLYANSGGSRRPSAVWLRPGLARTASEITPIDFGSFSNLMTFSGDRLYVARWDCFLHAGGVTLDVLDRKTFALIRRVNVAGCDDEQQDAISSINVIQNRIVLSVEFRYDDDSRTNTIVIDADSLEVVEKIHAPGQLFFWDGHVGVCGGANEPPHELDLHSIPASQDSAELSVASWICGRDEFTSAADMQARKMGYTGGGVEGVGKQYVAIKRPGTRKISTLEFWDIARQRTAGPAPGTGVNLSWRGFSEDGHVAVLSQQFHDALRIMLYDVAKGSHRTVLDLPGGASNPNVVGHGRFVYAFLGRSMYVIDVQLQLVVYYEREFLGDGFADNGHGVDLNGFSNALFDGDRLLVLTFSGKESRTLDLHRFEKMLGDDV